MKCFGKLILCHIKASLPPSFDPHQFSYRANRSTEDAIALTVHITLSHLEHQKSYVRMLFIDISSAFNTIIPDILVDKLLDSPLPSLSAPAPHRAVCWAQSCTLGTHMIANQLTCPKTSLSLLTTQLWSDSSLGKMRRYTGTRYRNWVVFSEQPGTEHHKNKGNNTGL